MAAVIRRRAPSVVSKTLATVSPPSSGAYRSLPRPVQPHCNTNLKDREVSPKNSRPTGAGHSSRAVARIGWRPCRPVPAIAERGGHVRGSIAEMPSRQVCRNRPARVTHAPTRLPKAGIVPEVGRHRFR